MGYANLVQATQGNVVTPFVSTGHQYGAVCLVGLDSSRSRVVSFDRPYANDYANGAGTYTYWTDLTLAAADYPLSMRDRTVRAADRGVNLIFFGASAILRKVRLQASPLGPNRQIVNYRDPHADPLSGIDNAQVSQNQWLQPPANWTPSELVGANYIGYNNGAAAPLVDSDPSSWLFAHSRRAGQRFPAVPALCP
jgi:hypothetical protein